MALLPPFSLRHADVLCCPDMKKSPTLLQAPSFSLKDRNGKVYSLSKFSDDFLVVYFYPKDDTPGCTLEAVGFNDALAKFKKLGARVIGISGGDEKSKQKFCQKHDLQILLLSDPDFAVAKAYGAYGEKSFMGRKFKGIRRNTYLLDKKRRIIHTFENVKAKLHPEEVLEFLAAKPCT